MPTTGNIGGTSVASVSGIYPTVASENCLSMNNIYMYYFRTRPLHCT